MFRLEGFHYGTTLDLNIGYLYIEISAKSKELFTIVTQWGNCKYQQLPMGLCISSDIFQENMSECFVGLDTVCVYIDEFFHVTKGSRTEHITFLKEMFACLQKDRLNVKAGKSCFGAN